MLLAICAAPIAIPLILVVVAMVLGLVVLILALVAGVAVGGVVAIGAGVLYRLRRAFQCCSARACHP